MSSAPARRRRSAVSAWVGVLLAALAVGLLCGGVSGGFGGSGGSGGFAGVRAEAEAAEAGETLRTAVAPDRGGVGCGKSKHDESSEPATPTRGGAAYELLSTLAYEHGTAATCAAHSPTPGGSPDRDPPPRDPPTPVELSVLRV